MKQNSSENNNCIKYFSYSIFIALITLSICTGVYISKLQDKITSIEESLKNFQKNQELFSNSAQKAQLGLLKQPPVQQNSSINSNLTDLINKVEQLGNQILLLENSTKQNFSLFANESQILKARVQILEQKFDSINGQSQKIQNLVDQNQLQIKQLGNNYTLLVNRKDEFYTFQADPFSQDFAKAGEYFITSFTQNIVVSQKAFIRVIVSGHTSIINNKLMVVLIYVDGIAQGMYDGVSQYQSGFYSGWGNTRSQPDVTTISMASFKRSSDFKIQVKIYCEAQCFYHGVAMTVDIHKNI